MSDAEFQYGYWFVAVLSTALCILVITGLLSNLAVLAVHRTNRQLASAIDNAFVRNLNLADLFICVSAIPLTITLVVTGSEYRSTTVCLAHEASTSFACLASAANVVVVSVNRQNRIADSLSRSFEPRHMKRAIVATWVVAIAGAITPVSVVLLTPHDENAAFWNVTSTTHTCFRRMLTVDARIYWDICYTCIFFVASLTVVVSYARIMITARNRIRVRMAMIRAVLVALPVVGPIKSSPASDALRSQGQTVKWMSLLVIASFILCWSPYYVIRFLMSDIDDEALVLLLEKLEFVFLTLAYVTISLHPFIYGFSRRAIRNAVAEQLTCCNYMDLTSTV
ncbi:G-protein coupled receptor 22 [Lamellibrachia satsuma]|nr:G-protein coupled receptor 22 [Lamellibrachia satsuma]